MEKETVAQHHAGLPVRRFSVDVRAGVGTGAVRAPVVGVDEVTVGAAPGNTIVIVDETVSRFHLAVRRVQDRVAVVDLGSKNGTRIGPVLFRDAPVEVTLPVDVQLGGVTLRITDGDVVMAEDGPAQFGAMRARSTAMRQLLLRAERVAHSEIGVLLLGESGTGKELLAHAIHAASARAAMPFEVVDCGALLPSLVPSTLFGHERGAFTGADKRQRGAFQRAEGGTLFLDEIGDLAPDAQAALLGALERRRIRPLGADKDIEVDVRVIAATSKDLRAAVNASTFRLDLYHRIGAVLLEIPPLRARPQDIPFLISHFAGGAQAGTAHTVQSLFTPAVLDELMRRPWPGNVRELRNVVYAAAATGELPAGEGSRSDARAASPDSASDAASGAYKEQRRRAVDAFERAFLADLMRRCEGNVRRAAREAQMDRNYLTSMLHRHGLKLPQATGSGVVSSARPTPGVPEADE